MPTRPLRIAQATKASHVILTGYGHWLPNDVRGSGSDEVRKYALKSLGPIHHGRKRVQPPRDTLRDSHRAAEPLLAHEVLWFDAAARQRIAETVAAESAARGHTLWAFSVMQNHLHAVVRTHRDPIDVIIRSWEQATTNALIAHRHVPAAHPVCSCMAHRSA